MVFYGYPAIFMLTQFGVLCTTALHVIFNLPLLPPLLLPMLPPTAGGHRVHGHVHLPGARVPYRAVGAHHRLLPGPVLVVSRETSQPRVAERATRCDICQLS